MPANYRVYFCTRINVEFTKSSIVIRGWWDRTTTVEDVGRPAAVRNAEGVKEDELVAWPTQAFCSAPEGITPCDRV